MVRPYHTGDIVRARSRRGIVDCVIASTRVISKGRYAGTVEYTCAPLQSSGKWYSITFKGESLFSKPVRTYTEKQVEDAVQKMRNTAQRVAQKKHVKAERGRDAIGDYDYQKSTYDRASGTNIGIGDKVRVQYREGRRWERVVWVNLKTGKVAIAKKVPAYVQDDSDELMNVLNLILGQRGRKRGRRDYRYIHPDHIIEVEKRD